MRKKTKQAVSAAKKASSVSWRKVKRETRKIIVNPIYAEPGQSIQADQLRDFEWDYIGKECGPSSPGFWTRLLEKAVPEFIFNEACKRHDLNYKIGGTELDRLLADKQFLADMRFEARKQPKRWRYIYYALAYVYYKAVRRFGDSAFEYRGKKLTWDMLYKEMVEAGVYG